MDKEVANETDPYPCCPVRVRVILPSGGELKRKFSLKESTMRPLLLALFGFLVAQTGAGQIPLPRRPFLQPLEVGKGPYRSSNFVNPGDWHIPQIANSGTPESGGLFMMFSAVNVTSGSATFTVEFFDSQGAPMSMPLVGGEGIGFTGTLQPGGYGAQVTIPNGSGTRIGYAKLTSVPKDSVALNATYVQLVPGRPPFMAGIPLTSVLHSIAYMPYVADGGFTPSLALVSVLSQTVTLTARSGLDGAVRCSTALSFGFGEHRAFLLRDVLPCTATGEGSLEIRGTSSVAALSGIGFLANDEGAFVTQSIWTSTETLF